MFFSKKESNKKLPDLPPSKLGSPPFGSMISPPLFDSRMEDNSLPSFPDSPDHNRFSQAVIKDAVSESEIPMGNYKGEDSITEIEEWKPSTFKANVPKRRELVKEEVEEEEEDEEDVEEEEEPPRFVKREYKPLRPMDSMEQNKQRNEDIFVKLDKFHSAKRSLQEIKGKLDEMNELLRKIREVKLREEQELAMWEKDMVHIKSRIQHVTENIFEKVE